MSENNLPDTNDHTYIRIGLVVVFLIFFGFGTWAALAELESGVPAGGKVVVASNKKIIQYLEGGIIEAIYVKDGDHVKKGDKLIKFSTIKTESELNSMLANYYENIALRDRLIAENRLIAEHKGEETIQFSAKLNILPSLKKDKIIRRHMEIFRNEISYMKKNELIAKQKKVSLEQQISSLKKVVITKKILLETYTNEVKEQSSLLEKGLVDKEKLLNAQRKIKSIESDILSSQANIEKFTAQIESITTQLQLDREKFLTDLNTKLSKAQTSIEDMQARINNLKDKLSRTIVKSPVDGIVMNLAFHTIGAVVAPGKKLMEIVPNDAKLIIEAKLSPEYIDFVKVGHKANMTFPSFQMKGHVIENIQGEVIFVSPDITVDEKGNSFYIVKLKLTEKGKEVLKKNNLEVQAGMPVSIIIKAGKQTTLEYLLKPMTMMLQKAFLEQ
ncbi:HlyD family type I secretion periplasmic adaptor subunit [Sulfurimonas sp. NW15]|uniref:HlyD family type I secretion periplasmic adaptor subunit n=1 Tax=Sulfurimonas sp. NW15 TaxID=2922729 RepID=UPI003DAA4533